ncbi:hypothetical protein B0O99DRAFT_184777 [Bisporella sp. PMI_857]|nr:hypothetical protein B0O99DRAFT_184777 [Bisporella sp. PMI_857]
MTVSNDEKRTLATVWICIVLSVMIMATRLGLGRWCKKKYGLGEALTTAAIFFALTRIAITQVIVLWKTNNISPDLGDLNRLSKHDIQQREIASKITLVARCIYIILLWLQKSVLLTFYNGLLKDLPAGRRAIMIVWVILGLTFVATITSTFTECRPFNHYWKVLPETDVCTEAIIQLFVVGGLNMLTDILLLLLPIPVLINVRLTWQKKAQLTFLFSVGLVIIAVTAVRLPRTYDNATSETHRITWTTGEFLAATFVANAPTLYSFRKRLQQKSQVVRRFSRSGPHIRATTELGGTTLTEYESDEAAEERRRDDIEAQPEIQRPAETRKPSYAKVKWSASTDNEK